MPRTVWQRWAAAALTVTALSGALVVAGPAQAAHADPSCPASALPAYPTQPRTVPAADVRELQAQLQGSGYYHGTPDGSWGPITSRALQCFLTHHYFRTTIDGSFGPGSIRQLQAYFGWVYGDNSYRLPDCPVDGQFGPGTLKYLRRALKGNLFNSEGFAARAAGQPLR